MSYRNGESERDQLPGDLKGIYQLTTLEIVNPNPEEKRKILDQTNLGTGFYK